MARRIPHDRLFKELITAFFPEFLEAFVPEVARDVDGSHVRFLPQELFAEPVGRPALYVDVLAETRLKGGGETVLVHVEVQARRERRLAERMWRYYLRLCGTYGHPVVSVAVLAGGGRRGEPAEVRIGTPGWEAARFRYYAVELGRLDWRAYAGLNNPAASALMGKMRHRAEEREEMVRSFGSRRRDGDWMKRG